MIFYMIVSPPLVLEEVANKHPLDFPSALRLSNDEQTLVQSKFVQFLYQILMERPCWGPNHFCWFFWQSVDGFYASFFYFLNVSAVSWSWVCSWSRFIFNIACDLGHHFYSLASKVETFSWEFSKFHWKFHLALK